MWLRSMFSALHISNFGSRPMSFVCEHLARTHAFHSVVCVKILMELPENLTGGARDMTATPNFEF